MATIKRPTAGKPLSGKAPGSSSAGKKKAPPPPPSRRNLWIGIAAVVVIAAVAWFLFRPRHRTTVDLISPKPESTQSTTTFVWHPMDGISTYEIEIITESGDPTFATTVSDTSVQAPADKFEKGKSYLWLVRAIVKGEAKAASSIDRFTYQP